ncbi:hypothetical protein [Paraburkholderia youngii]|uniref:hypothetical protein n=1 Tax=Paraburkholderia youngii TaxID=2782701 RepID=UPI003D1BEFCF
MRRLSENAASIYARLLEEVGPKARSSLERIRDACDEIELVRGTMNFSRVAAIATERFGGPRNQTIQNNKSLKLYITARVAEYSAVGRGNGGNRETHADQRQERDEYPSDRLDPQVRLCIDLLRGHHARLEAENKQLSALLERETEKQPVSLSTALALGPAEDLSLRISVPHRPTSIPAAMMAALKLIFDGEVTAFQVERKDALTRLVASSPGELRVLLTPADWVTARTWLSTVSDVA